MGNFLRQRRTGRLGQQLIIRHDGRKAEALVHIPLDGIDHAFLIDAAGQAAQQGRGHVVRVALDAGGQREQLLRVQDIAQHPVRAQQTGDDARRGGAKAPRHGDGVGLDDLQRRDLLADFIEQPFGRAVDQIGFVAGDAGAVRRRDIQLVALLKSDRVVQRDGQTQRIKAGADVGAGGRNRDLDLHSCPFPFMLPPADA